MRQILQQDGKCGTENARSLRVVGNFRSAGKGVMVCSRRHVSSENPRTQHEFQAPSTLLGRGTLAVYELELDGLT